MNTPSPAPDLEFIRKAMREFQPNPRRVPFTNLKPFHDSLVELRGKNASYDAIADLLKQNGVNTSRARVAEYGRIVLDGGKRRKRRKCAHTMSAFVTPVTPLNGPTEAQIATPTVTPPVTNQLQPPLSGDFTSKSRGPRIARIRLLDGTIAGEKCPGQTP
jgi:hypothetical protein